MKSNTFKFAIISGFVFQLFSMGVFAQEVDQNKVVVITGVRFAYPLVQKWIDDYAKVNTGTQIIIESRGTNDPTKYDILVEAYDQDEKIKNSREYVYIAQYAIVPVANAKSSFAKVYTDKGLDQALIKQLFFHDLYADTERQEQVKVPYTVYTRLQKAGAPITFTKYFGYEQKDIKGKAIAGADEHLLKAIIRDSNSLSYLPLSLAYDHTTKKVLNGLAVLPVDLNGNNRVSDDEKFYNSDVNLVIQQIESKEGKERNNIPVAYLHLSVDKATAKPEALDFIKWLIENGQNDLHDFGYLKPEPDRLNKEKFEQFASRKIEQ